MAVGDVTSDKRGSGARFNDDKIQMDLIPVSFWIANWIQNHDLAQHHGALAALEALCAFQEGDDDAVHAYMNNLSMPSMLDAAQVLEYGAKKYKAWNWAKGMKWSVPTGCILRHAWAILQGDDMDGESGEPHMGHIDCNMLMLSWFQDHYQEGDDRPPVLEGVEVRPEDCYAMSAILSDGDLGAELDEVRFTGGFAHG